MIPSCRVSTATHRKHAGIDPEHKIAPIPQLIWSDGHAEWSRWYWFKEDCDRIGKGYYTAFGG